MTIPRVAGEIITFLSVSTLPADMRCRAEQLALDIIEQQQQHDLIDLPMPVDPRLVRVVQLALADLGHDRSLENWGDLAAMSPRNFTRRFRTETGMSFGNWRTLARMRLASTLLAADEPLAMVAGQVGGYSTTSAFVSAFKRVVGQTPGAITQAAQKWPVRDMVWPHAFIDEV